MCLKEPGALRSALVVVVLAVGSLLLAVPRPVVAQGTWTATSTTNAPTARWGPTAVWTGSKMIVWGGCASPGNVPLKTGGIYDPATDTWTATSTTNAPTGRVYHAAVWTGSKMIVWGGNVTGFGYLSTGGIYDPATDTWTATSMTNAPTARMLHTAVWTGSKMIVWGGSRGLGGYPNTGGIYDPATDTWTATSTTNAPAGRANHTAVWTGSKMAVWGGQQDVTFDYVNTGGIYDPATDSWTATSTTNAPAARVGHTAVWTGSKTIIWGGLDAAYAPVNTGGIYDPGADSWTATSTTNAPTGRTSHTAVWTGSKMTIWGGQEDVTFTRVNTGGIYDPATDTWTATSITNAPTARSAHTAVWTGSKMIVWGGDSVSTPTNTGGVYDALALPPPPTDFHTVTPCRVFDSRDPGLGGPTPFAGGSQNAVTVAGHCGIPTEALAVSLNVTVTAPTAQGHLRLYPGGAALPLVSTINYVAGQTRANNAVTPLGAAGALAVYVGQSSGSVHVIIDVNGYFE